MQESERQNLRRRVVERRARLAHALPAEVFRDAVHISGYAEYREHEEAEGHVLRAVGKAAGDQAVEDDGQQTSPMTIISGRLLHRRTSCVPMTTPMMGSNTRFMVVILVCTVRMPDREICKQAATVRGTAERR